MKGCLPHLFMTPTLIGCMLPSRGQPLFSVPASAWINADAAKRSAIGPLVADLEPWLQLALFLLYEGGQPSSPWRPYLDTLPAQGVAPLFWSEAELKELEGTQVLLSVQGYRWVSHEESRSGLSLPA